MEHYHRKIEERRMTLDRRQVKDKYYMGDEKRMAARRNVCNDGARGSRFVMNPGFVRKPEKTVE